MLNPNECIVALDGKGNGWIIVQSEYFELHDIMPEATVEDNNFDDEWEKGLGVGVYKLTCKPWSSYTDMTGEYDCGIDVTHVERLWVYSDDKIVVQSR